MSTANKLQYLIDAKISISAAIEAKGGDVPQELSGYGPAIEALPSGGPSPEQLTYVLYDNNTISSYLIENRLSAGSIATPTPNPAVQNAKVVQIGNAISSLGDNSFYGVSSLTAITIPDSVKRINKSFWRCYGLTSISIPDSVEQIGLSASPNSGPFGSSNTIVASAADACSNLVSVDLGNSVKIIGSGSFGWCVNLSSITIPDSVKVIWSGAFVHCHSLSSINIPDSVVTIGGSAFAGCTNLSSITIPDSVTDFRSASLLSGCSGLTNAIIGNGATGILNGCFNWCTALTSVTLGNSISSIANNAFQRCEALPSITFPSSVKSIGSYAFNFCSSCTIFDFSSATAVPTLGSTNAFRNTPADKKIIVPDALYDQWKAANNWNSSTNGIVDAITKASEA